MTQLGLLPLAPRVALPSHMLALPLITARAGPHPPGHQ